MAKRTYNISAAHGLFMLEKAHGVFLQNKETKIFRSCIYARINGKLHFWDVDNKEWLEPLASKISNFLALKFKLVENPEDSE